MVVDEQKTVVRRYFEEFHNARNMAIAPEIAPESQVEFIQRLAGMMRAAFPDYQITITEMVAERDLVATVWRGQGTHTGEWQSPMGPIPATGKSITWTATTTLRLVDGKIAETVGTNWDHLGILQQMEVLPTFAPRSGA
jgi:predicted ester cyclase